MKPNCNPTASGPLARMRSAEPGAGRCWAPARGDPAAEVQHQGAAHLRGGDERAALRVAQRVVAAVALLHVVVSEETRALPPLGPLRPRRDVPLATLQARPRRGAATLARPRGDAPARPRQDDLLEVVRRQPLLRALRGGLAVGLVPLGVGLAGA